jgi:hypothetical protein
MAIIREYQDLQECFVCWTNVYDIAGPKPENGTAQTYNKRQTNESMLEGYEFADYEGVRELRSRCEFDEDSSILLTWECSLRLR